MNMQIGHRWTPELGMRRERSLWTALKRGWRCRCPACGEGRLFRSYLKVNTACPACAEPLHHHRADDLPAYLVIVIVGHIVVPLALAIEKLAAPAIWLQLAIYLPMTLVLSVLLLPPVKGAVVGMQWALRMHGFDENDPDHGKAPDEPSSRTVTP